MKYLSTYLLVNYLKRYIILFNNNITKIRMTTVIIETCVCSFYQELRTL